MAVALSLDAFSIALIIGLFENNPQKYVTFSLIVGVLHFIMPSLGSITNSLILKNLLINSNIFIGVVLLTIAFSMILDFKNDNQKVNSTNIWLLSLSVSIDSYFAGIALKSLNNFNMLIFLYFSFFSFTFSFAGCMLGRLGHKKLGKISNIVAILILIMLSVKYIIFN